LPGRPHSSNGRLSASQIFTHFGQLIVLLECSGFGAANVPSTYFSAISSTLGGQRESAAAHPRCSKRQAGFQSEIVPRSRREKGGLGRAAAVDLSTHRHVRWYFHRSLGLRTRVKMRQDGRAALRHAEFGRCWCRRKGRLCNLAELTRYSRPLPPAGFQTFADGRDFAF